MEGSLLTLVNVIIPALMAICATSAIFAVLNCLLEKHVQPKPIGEWNPIGIYDLRNPTTKAERALLANAQESGFTGTGALLYQRTYKSGKKAWRYHLGDVDWIYPTRTQVTRRGVMNDGVTPLLDE